MLSGECLAFPFDKGKAKGGSQALSDIAFTAAGNAHDDHASW
jgi:hypothetical protein